MTGRKIIFITNEFFDNNNSIKEQIVDGIRTFYYLGYNDDKELPILKDKIVTEFRKDTENFKLNKVNIEDLYKPLLIMLSEIHLYCINSINEKK